MSVFLRHAEEILEIAARGEEEVAIVIDRHGGVRMIDPAGWSLPSLCLEYGARFVYKVERRAGMLRVEGWDGARPCLLQRRLLQRRLLQRRLLQGRLLQGPLAGRPATHFPHVNTGGMPALRPAPPGWPMLAAPA